MSTFRALTIDFLVVIGHVRIRYGARDGVRFLATGNRSEGVVQAAPFVFLGLSRSVAA